MAVYTLLTVTLVLVLRFLYRSDFSKLGLAPKLRPLLFGILAGIALAGVLWAAYALLLDFRVHPDASLGWTGFIFAFQATSSLFVITLLHCFFLSAFRKWLGAAAAVCLVGLAVCVPTALFTDTHTVIPTVNSFLFAAFCAAVTLRTGSVCWAAGFHWAWFAFSSSVAGIGELGTGMGPSLLAARRTGYSVITGGEFGVQYSLLFTLALGILWALLLLAGKLAGKMKGYRHCPSV
jgi:hypothetical protein